MEVGSQEYIQALIQLTEDLECEDPIDWGMLNISEENAYQLCAINLVEIFRDKYNDPCFKEVALATILKLTVENFVLNIKLLQERHNDTSM